MVRLLGLLPLVIGVSLCLYGSVGAVLYFSIPKPTTIESNQVIDLAHCSGGFATGNCPVLDFHWSGTLVSPSRDAISKIWGLSSASPNTCGLPATYRSNIPTVSSNQSQVPGLLWPSYEPLGSNVRGVVTADSIVYVYTSATYTVADHCSGSDYPQGTNLPVHGDITYPLGGNQRITFGASVGYNFSDVYTYFGGFELGAFLGVFGGILYFETFGESENSVAQDNLR